MLLLKGITPTIQQNLNTLFGKMTKSGKLSTDSSERLKCYTGTITKFYGLPKIHKPGFPLRPIVDLTCFPHLNLTKYLANLLKPLNIETKYICLLQSNYLGNIKK